MAGSIIGVMVSDVRVQDDLQRLRAWLLLVRAPGVGPARIRDILTHFPDLQDFLSAGHKAQKASGLLKQDALDFLAHSDDAILADDFAWLERADARLFTLADSDYPALLRQIADPPPVLYVLGDAAALAVPQVAIVGSRNPSRPGRELAEQFAAGLSQVGFAITSGLAAGIDGAAHEGALNAGGRTLAVLGTGVDRVYPANHRDLARRIVAEGGALVSEFPLGTGPHASHFPRRNRILSGLALGTLVVEAALRSGSLITARQALEQGREVFAIPGSIHNPLARGCHRLIRDGAKLVESVDDVLEDLEGLVGYLRAQLESTEPEESPARASALAGDPDEAALLAALGADPASIDQLVERTGLTADRVSSMLLALELQGRVQMLPGGRAQVSGR
jgi:DNA processing protein